MSGEETSGGAPDNEREDLRKQIDELRAAEESARTEIAALKDQIAELTAKREAHVKLQADKRRRTRILLVVSAIFLVVGGTIGAVLYFTHVQEETIRGHVVSVDGNAPAEMDDTCIVSIASASFPFNTHISVVCGGRRLYGYGSFGYVKCETEESRVSRCEDGGSIREDGDPFLVLNRNNRSLMLSDLQRWRIRIELDVPPPAPTPEPGG